MADRSGLSKGVPIGLSWTLFFLLSFYFLGYSAIVSIFLALLGGGAVGVIVDWWWSKDEFIAPPGTPQHSGTDPQEPESNSSDTYRAPVSTTWRRSRKHKRLTWMFRGRK